MIVVIQCFESDPQSRTDNMYVKSVLEQHYKHFHKIKFAPIYMGSKHVYKSRKTLRNIGTIRNQVSPNDTVHVVYFLDKDQHLSSFEDAEFVRQAESFANQNGYHIVWFVKQIEDVFLTSPVKSSEKVARARRTLRSIHSNGYHHYQLRIPNPQQPGESNMLLILDQLLIK